MSEEKEVYDDDLDDQYEPEGYHTYMWVFYRKGQQSAMKLAARYIGRLIHEHGIYWEDIKVSHAHVTSQYTGNDEVSILVAYRAPKFVPLEKRFETDTDEKESE